MRLVVVVIVAQSRPTLCDPWTVASQASLSMEFPWQEYWTGLPFPSSGDLPHPGVETVTTCRVVVVTIIITIAIITMLNWLLEKHKSWDPSFYRLFFSFNLFAI